MADPTLHADLRAREYRLGDVIDYVPASIVYDPRRTASPLATKAAEREPENAYPAVVSGAPGKAVGSVIASHDCDVDRSPQTTPLVEVMRAFAPSAEFLERVRGGIRFFVLSDDPLYVVQAEGRSWIDKGALVERTQLFRPAPAVLPAFTDWLAQQYDRPSFPQDVIDNVCAPIREAIDQHRSTPVGSFYEHLRVVSVRPAAASTYYRAEVLVVMHTVEGHGDAAAALAALIADRLRSTGKAELQEWRLVQPDTIALGDFESYSAVFADD